MAAQNSKRAAPGRPFAKGKSGNPGGRPKLAPEIKEAARAYTVEAIETLAKVMRSGDTSQARAMAADRLLDRGWGKATQHIEAKVNVLDQLTPEQQLALEHALAAFPDDEAGSAAGTAPTTH